jgi:hypothetical protein
MVKMTEFPEDSSLISIRHSPAETFGVEAYYLHPFDMWTLAGAEIIARKNYRKKPIAIEFGGASGFMAMQLARRGFDVVLIDRLNLGDSDIIAKRNSVLALEHPGNGKIEYWNKNVLDLTSSDLMDMCHGQKPTILSARQFLHWFQADDQKSFLVKSSEIAAQQAILSMSYLYVSGGDSDPRYKDFLDEKKIKAILKENGFSLLLEKCTQPNAGPISPNSNVHSMATRQVYVLDRR